MELCFRETEFLLDLERLRHMLDAAREALFNLAWRSSRLDVRAACAEALDKLFGIRP